MAAEQSSTNYTFDGLAAALAKGDTSRPPAVVASVFQTGLNLMRDLEQKGIRVIGIDLNPENPGFRSRYAKSYLCPNPDKNPDDWAAFMLALAAAIGEKPVLIAASDIFVSAIGRHVEVLSDHFLFSKAGAKLQAALATKETQYALAREYGLPSPWPPTSSPKPISSRSASRHAFPRCSSLSTTASGRPCPPATHSPG